MSVREANPADAEIAALGLRIRGLENEVEKWRRRAYYAEAAARDADATVCPMAIGDPHNFCGMADAMADSLAAAIGRDPTLADWLDERTSDVEKPANR